MADLTSVLIDAVPRVGWRYRANAPFWGCSLLAQVEGVAHPGNSHCEPSRHAPLSQQSLYSGKTSAFHPVWVRIRVYLGRLLSASLAPASRPQQRTF